MTGLVHNIQKYSVHDGGGIRTVVFFQGCPLRCRWCSNPETQPLANPRLYWRNKCIGCGRCVEVCPRHIGCRDLHSPDCRMCLACVENCCTGALTLAAQEMTVKELVQKLLRDEVYYHNSGGGVTLSGGEVLLQWQFAAAVLAALREQCIHTAIETAGFAPYEHLKAVADQCSRVLYDVKSMDDAVHRSYIGVSNRQILDNLCRLADSGAEVIVRVPLIHNVNDSAENITRTAELAAAHGIREIDLLPFHRLGESKYAVIQQPYTMPDATVPQEHIDALAALLRQRGFIVSIGG